MASHEVSLPDQLDAFVRRSVEQGQYESTSDVVRAGLRLLQQQELQDREKIRVLRRVAEESFSAIDRGEFVDVSANGLDAFLNEVESKASGHRGK